MKRISVILLALLALLLTFGCSENDDPTDVDVLGYSLDQFIDKTVVIDSLDAAMPDTTEFRQLYNYEIVSGDEDAWSPRLSVNAGYDLDWNAFKSGYLVPTDDNSTWFADPTLPHAFDVKNTGLFRLYRKIEVNSGRGTKNIELRGLPIYDINNWDGNQEQAVKLSDLLQGIASYDSVRIVCYDGYGVDKYYQAAAINDGYYLLNSERTIFPTATLPNNQKKMKKVAYIDVIGGGAQNYDFQNAPNTAADVVFTRPTSLTGYTSTVLPIDE
ncbi:MAG TPA: hypothetical protein PL124_09290 [Candidatus Cloacimonadota bacterium]|nr:hypothetical protein [Candidatus Cloacimonadota bacterium]